MDNIILYPTSDDKNITTLEDNQNKLNGKENIIDFNVSLFKNLTSQQNITI